MFDAEEIRWVKSTANELNNLLQVITESSQFLENHTESNADTQKYFDILRNGVERAAQVSRLMLERVGEYEKGSHTETVFESSKPSAAFGFEPMKPAAPASPAPAPQPAAAPQTPSSQQAPATIDGDIRVANPNGPKELIMIVDDEAFVTLLALRVLTDDGYRVITARDGFECLNIYKRLKERISLIIMDFTMPIMDGSEVFDELRVINPRVCVVLSSGFTEQEKLRGMLAKGLRGFIPKPYTQQKLLLQVRTTLDTLKSEK
jgi:CheY-like chemotaxis protein